MQKGTTACTSLEGHIIPSVHLKNPITEEVKVFLTLVIVELQLVNKLTRNWNCLDEHKNSQSQQRSLK